MICYKLPTFKMIYFTLCHRNPNIRLFCHLHTDTVDHLCCRVSASNIRSVNLTGGKYLSTYFSHTERQLQCKKILTYPVNQQCINYCMVYSTSKRLQSEKKTLLGIYELLIWLKTLNSRQNYPMYFSIKVLVKSIAHGLAIFKPAIVFPVFRVAWNIINTH